MDLFHFRLFFFFYATILSTPDLQIEQLPPSSHYIGRISKGSVLNSSDLPPHVHRVQYMTCGKLQIGLLMAFIFFLFTTQCTALCSTSPGGSKVQLGGHLRLLEWFSVVPGRSLGMVQMVLQQMELIQMETFCNFLSEISNHKFTVS